MEKFCEKCGAPLDENGTCPKCAAEEALAQPQEAEQAPKPEVKAENQNTEAKPEPQPKAPDSAQADEQSSKFACTAKQVWSVIKGFFTKNAVDTIASQYNDAVPIWGILIPAYAVIAAISATAAFNSSGHYETEVTALIKDVSFGSGEVFFLNLALSLVSLFALSFAVRLFIKLHKGDGHWTMSANLVTAAHLPLMMINVFNIVTGGVVSGLLTWVTSLGTCAVYMLIFAGISKALGGKKPIWSFFLMIICATAAAVVVTVFVASPVIFSRVAYSIMDSFG